MTFTRHDTGPSLTTETLSKDKDKKLNFQVVKLC